MERIVHVLFDPDAAHPLRQAFDIDPTLRDDILVLEDDYRFGPVVANPNVWEMRKQWLKDHLYGQRPDTEIIVFQEGLLRRQLRERMESDDQLHVWIWMTNHLREVCGYFALLPWISDFDQRVELIFLHNLPFLNEKYQVFFPEKLSQIPAREYPKAKRLATPLTTEEMLADSEEWQRLQQHNSLLRKASGERKCQHIPVESYDAALLKCCTAEGMRLTKLLSVFRQQTKTDIQDTFWIWRLQQMADRGLIEVQGEWLQKPWIRLAIDNPSEIQVKDSSIDEMENS
ncbi:MAG: DUF1835 domain-containing protein [Thermoflavifilum sp.]|nr:DUF1835 domain-containing protein [Thermoflavifilum sp.]